MQKVVLPSSVDQALFATSEKFSNPFTSLTETRLPFLNRSRDASNGRQVMRSPAVPPARRALRAALYSVGGSALNCTLMFGCFLLKAGMILVFHTSASSLRQLSMVRVWAEAALAKARAAAATEAPASTCPARRRNAFEWGFVIVFVLRDSRGA